MSDFIIGSTARIPVEITDPVANVLADPGGLILKIRKPDKALTILTYGIDTILVKVSTGLYHADIDLDQAGKWKWRWEAVAPNSGAVEGYLQVLASYVL
jgi:hypothetical protein